MTATTTDTTTDTTTVLITTKDRKEELGRALESVLVQEGVSEILVFDDGSSDGTSEFVRARFPAVRCERSEKPLGIVAARNCAVAMAKGSIVLTIDDDCVFQCSTTVIDTVNDFRDGRIGAVAIPHINVFQSAVVCSHPPRTDRAFAISEFTGCASAVRKDLFVALGGFDPLLWRQCEEYDFCTRLLTLGYVTRCGSATPVLHYESPNRNTHAIQYHAARGHLLYAWRNVPLWILPLHAVVSTMKCLRHAQRHGRLRSGLSGVLSAIWAILALRCERRSVGLPVYRLMRRLRTEGPIELASIARLRACDDWRLPV